MFLNGTPVRYLDRGRMVMEISSPAGTTAAALEEAFSHDSIPMRQIMFSRACRSAGKGRKAAYRSGLSACLQPPNAA